MSAEEVINYLNKSSFENPTSIESVSQVENNRSYFVLVLEENGFESSLEELNRKLEDSKYAAKLWDFLMKSKNGKVAAFKIAKEKREFEIFLNGPNKHSTVNNKYFYRFSLRNGILFVDYCIFKKINGRDTTECLANWERSVFLDDLSFHQTKIEGNISCSILLKIFSSGKINNQLLNAKVSPIEIDSKEIKLLYNCNQEELINLYQDGLRYLISLLKYETDKIYITNPFQATVTDRTDLIISLVPKGSLYNIWGNIHNERVSFIFDSGASETSINQSLFEKLYTADSTLFSKISDEFYRMADGSVKKQPRYLLRELKISNHTLNNITLTISPENSPNLLGNSVLKRFSSWNIDQKSHTLTLKW